MESYNSQGQDDKGSGLRRQAEIRRKLEYKKIGTGRKKIEEGNEGVKNTNE